MGIGNCDRGFFAFCVVGFDGQLARDLIAWPAVRGGEIGDGENVDIRHLIDFRDMPHAPCDVDGEVARVPPAGRPCLDGE